MNVWWEQPKITTVRLDFFRALKFVVPCRGQYEVATPLSLLSLKVKFSFLLPAPIFLLDAQCKNSASRGSIGWSQRYKYVSLVSRQLENSTSRGSIGWSQSYKYILLVSRQLEVSQDLWKKKPHLIHIWKMNKMRIEN